MHKGYYAFWSQQFRQQHCVIFESVESVRFGSKADRDENCAIMTMNLTTNNREEADVKELRHTLQRLVFP